MYHQQQQQQQQYIPPQHQQQQHLHQQQPAQTYQYVAQQQPQQPYYPAGTMPTTQQQQQQQPVYAPQQQMQQQAVVAAPPPPVEQQYMPGGNDDAMYEIDRQEYVNGVRMVWNEWPLTKLDQERAVFKLGVLYTPLKPLAAESTGVVMYEPVRCKAQQCQGVLNPWVQVDFASKTWVCCFCQGRNAFPPHYASAITETNLPAELLPENTTIEYQLPRFAGPPIFLFVVDTAIPDEELDELKDSLQQSLTILPPSALVGLITFGANVQVHELGFQQHLGSSSSSSAGHTNGGSHASSTAIPCSKAYVFRGSKSVTPERIFQMLGMSRAGTAAAVPVGNAPGAPTMNPQQGGGGGGGGGPHHHPQHHQHMPAGAERFLAPVGEIAGSLDKIIDDLRRDPWPTTRDMRPQRCTGVAISVAVTMMEKMCSKRGGRVIAFVGGPPTVGEGAVAEEKLETALRSHTDIEKGRATLFKPAKAFYEKIAARCVENCHAVDLFVCSLDQTGLLEMKAMVELTGGVVVLADSFGQSVFKESFRRLFTRHPDAAHECDRGALTMGLAGTLELVASPEVRIKGAIGSLCTLNKKGPLVSEMEVGQGGTWAWRICAMDQTSTVAIYLDTNMTASPQNRRRYLQFITHYQHSNGRVRVRVTTTGGAWQPDPHNIKSIAHSFDQQAAAVCLARVAVHRIETEAPLDIIRFVDRSLIRFCTQFASYRKNDPASFALAQEFALFPQFLFHLRRSPFLQIFNSSPDEAAYHRMTLLRENTNNSTVMIQPSLLSYSLENGATAQPVLLDSSSIRPDCILLLDTFFHVVVFHGENVAAWREQGYQDQPNYEAFRRLLHAPKDDAQALMQSRFPQPRYVVCDQHKSQSRFLVSKVNPSVTHNTQDGDFSSGGQAVFTDDANLKSFMDHLKAIATGE